MNVKLRAISMLSLLAATPVIAQSPPAIDNERVTVWDVSLKKGDSGPQTPHDMDVVVMFLEGGRIQTTDKGGKVRTVQHKFGDAVFIPKGRDAHDTLLSEGTAHEIVIALKDDNAPPAINNTGLPLAFPRPGSVKVLENKRVVVWHYSWKHGVPTPMHFHDKEVVVAYRYDGQLKSVTPDGTPTVNSFHAGEIRFNKANRSHFEELESERESAVMTEFK